MNCKVPKPTPYPMSQRVWTLGRGTEQQRGHRQQAEPERDEEERWELLQRGVDRQEVDAPDDGDGHGGKDMADRHVLNLRPGDSEGQANSDDADM